MTHAIRKDKGFDLDRRSFLRSGAAGLVISFTMGFDANDARAASGSMIGAYLQIDPSNIVTVYIGATEMGQGIMTGMAQLVAEELMLDWTKVRTEHAPADAAYANPLFHAQVRELSPWVSRAAVARHARAPSGAGRRLSLTVPSWRTPRSCRRLIRQA